MFGKRHVSGRDLRGFESLEEGGVLVDWADQKEMWSSMTHRVCCNHSRGQQEHPEGALCVVAQD